MTIKELITELSAYDQTLNIGFATKQGDLEILSIYSNEHRDSPTIAKPPTTIWIDLG